MKTFSFNKYNILNTKWWIIDATSIILGRLASKISFILQGKNNTYYTPNCNINDNVIVINSKYILISGKKYLKKKYWHHTGYPGGLQEISFLALKDKKPNFIIFNSIKRMLPKNKLRNVRLKKLRIYSNNRHPHLSQQLTWI